MVSYYDPEGHYAVDEEYFASQVNMPPLIGVKANYMTAGGRQRRVQRRAAPASRPR